jgi:hypothetical protein
MIEQLLAARFFRQRAGGIDRAGMRAQRLHQSPDLVVAGLAAKILQANVVHGKQAVMLEHMAEAVHHPHFIEQILGVAAHLGGAQIFMRTRPHCYNGNLAHYAFT